MRTTSSKEYKYVYVTGFAKMYIVHTSTFSTLKNHNNCYDYQTCMHETCRGCRAIIPLSVQQLSYPNVYPIMFYESLNVQNRMCELCMFSQIRSHIRITYSYVPKFLLSLPCLYILLYI